MIIHHLILIPLRDLSLEHGYVLSHLLLSLAPPDHLLEHLLIPRLDLIQPLHQHAHVVLQLLQLLCWHYHLLSLLCWYLLNQDGLLLGWWGLD